jgi:hypothetical protein
MGDPEPVGSLAAARIERAQITEVAGANACQLFRIGI